METQGIPEQPTPATAQPVSDSKPPTPAEGHPTGDSPDAGDASIAEFIEKSKKANDSWIRRTTGKPQSEKTPETNPDFFQKNEKPDDATPSEPVKTPSEPPAEVKPPETVQPTEGKKEPEAPQPQTHKLMIRGQEGEYSKVEVEQALEYAVVAQEREKAVARLHQELQAREQHPDVKMVQLLQSNPELREKVKAVLSEEDPQGANQHQFAEVNQLNAALFQRLNNLEKAIQQRDAQLSQAIQRRQQETLAAEQQAYAQKFISDINSQIQPRAQQLNVPPEIMDDLGWRAKRLIEAQKLSPTVESVVGFFNQEFEKFANIFRSQEDQIRNGYIQQKKQAPAPPPPSGGVPTVTPTAKTWSDAKSKARAYLEAIDRMGN